MGELIVVEYGVLKGGAVHPDGARSGFDQGATVLDDMSVKDSWGVDERENYVEEKGSEV